MGPPVPPDQIERETEGGCNNASSQIWARSSVESFAKGEVSMSRPMGAFTLLI